MAVPAGADPKGHIEAELRVGYFYGAFDQSPNVVLIVGSAADDLCEDNPGDPFSGEAGVAPHRLFPPADGSLEFARIPGIPHSFHSRSLGHIR